MLRIRRSTAILGAAILVAACLMLYLAIEVAHLPIRIDGFKEVDKNEITDLENRISRLENDLKQNYRAVDEIMSTVKGLLKVEYQKAPWKNALEMSSKDNTTSNGQEECLFAETSAQPVDYQMLAVYDKLSFDNPDGGVWKQGWPITYDSSQWNSSSILKVFVVPHSHNDPGWLKTFDQYYSDQTKHILNNLVKKLREDPQRKFIWAEISYFAVWWDSIPGQIRDFVLKLLKDGQLEIVTGGWVMNDEATTHYFAMLEQLVEGHTWMQNHLGIYPKNGWAIDPFGLSPTMAYLLKRMGLGNMVIQRVHYSIKKYFSKQKALEFFWRQIWDHNKSTDMFCHMMPFYSYDIPHTCGPNPEVCCQFDFKRLPGGGISCPWKVPPQAISNHNKAERAHLLLDQYRKKAQLYKSNVLLVPLGDDFRYTKTSEWDNQYNNYMQLFDYMNSQKDWHVKAQFGTLEDYFHALHKEQKAKFHNDPLSGFPTTSGDFFTYADKDDHYWSGYYTSRPFYKHMDRVLESHLRAAEIVFSIALAQLNSNDAVRVADSLLPSMVTARRNLGLFQHHDAITGTAKNPVVVDYALRLLDSIRRMKHVIVQSSQFLLSNQELDLTDPPILIMDETRKSHDSLPQKVRIDFMENKQRTIVVYNSLSQKRTEMITVHVSSPYVCIKDLEGNIVPNQINPVWKEKYLDIHEYKIVFVGEIAALGLSSYTVQEKTKDDIESCKISIPVVELHNFEVELQSKGPFEVIQGPLTSDFTIMNNNIEATFKPSGFLKSITLLNEKTTVISEIEFVTYGTRQGKGRSGEGRSGAYLFLPDRDAKSLKVNKFPLRIIRGSLVSSVQVKMPLVDHIVEIKQSPGLDGLGIDIHNMIDIRTEVNTEIAMRIVTSVASEDKLFYTDLNGFQILKRKSFEKLPIQANFYPFSSMAFIQDNNSRFSILTAQTLGVSSLQPGWLEVIMDRRLNQDDQRGLQQGVTDNKQTPNSFRLLLEKTSGNQQEQSSGAYSSLAGHLASSSLIHPFFIMHSITDNSTLLLSIQRQFTPVRTDLPCDIHLVNLRSSVSETAGLPDLYSLKNSSALFLHRLGHDCSVKHPGFACNTWNGQLSLEDLFPDHFREEVMQMSLSLLHEGQLVGKSQRLQLEPMELYAFYLYR